MEGSFKTRSSVLYLAQNCRASIFLACSSGQRRTRNLNKSQINSWSAAPCVRYIFSFQSNETESTHGDPVIILSYSPLLGTPVLYACGIFSSATPKLCL